MSDRVSVSKVRFTAASAGLRRNGLLGFVSIVVNDSLFLDSITVRRTLDSRLVLGFPRRRDSAGKDRPLMRPIHNGAREEIQTQVFESLRAQGVVS